MKRRYARRSAGLCGWARTGILADARPITAGVSPAGRRFDGRRRTGPLYDVAKAVWRAYQRVAATPGCVGFAEASLKKRPPGGSAVKASTFNTVGFALLLLLTTGCAAGLLALLWLAFGADLGAIG